VFILFRFDDTNIQHYFEFANYFKDNFNLFPKVLKIKEKKTAAYFIFSSAKPFSKVVI